MWKVSRTTRSVKSRSMIVIASGVLALSNSLVSAQTAGYNYPYPSSVYNAQSVQYGLNLPQAPMSNGSDEIRAADGTSCKSSISSNRPVLDVGVLGNQDFYGNIGSATVYGRVTMPLGQQPRRIDCTKLYQLEIERLSHELQLVRMGANGKGAGVAERGGSNWQTQGWSDTPSAAGGKSPHLRKLGASDRIMQPEPVTTARAVVVASAGTAVPPPTEAYQPAQPITVGVENRLPPRRLVVSDTDDWKHGFQSGR